MCTYNMKIIIKNIMYMYAPVKYTKSLTLSVQNKKVQVENYVLIKLKFFLKCILNSGNKNIFLVIQDGFNFYVY